MTEFKEKINEVLKSLNYSFDDLAGHLGMNSEQLNQAIDDKKVELRTLEFISKELRIPLYSFFRNEDFVPVNNLPEEPFYINKINKNTIDQLQIENILLRKEVENLKEQLIKCENKMKAFQKGLVVEPEYEIEATVEFQCTCGANKSVTKDIDTSDDLSDFDGYILNCKCGQNYEIELNDKDELVVKITYKK